MMRKFLAILLTITVCAGCSLSILDLPDEPIAFDSYHKDQNDPATKVGDSFVEGSGSQTSPFPSGKAFGVYGYFHPGNGNTPGSWDDGNRNHPNLYYNGRVTNDNGTYSVDPVRFWPKNTTDRISFFAYYPYDADASYIYSNLTANSDGEGFFMYEVPYNAEDHIDLMISDLCADQSKAVWKANNSQGLTGADGKVKFTFHHVLAQVRIRSVTILKESHVDISNISISFRNIPLRGQCYVTPTTENGLLVKDARGNVVNQFSWPKNEVLYTRKDLTTGVNAKVCYDEHGDLIPEQVLMMIPYNFAYDPNYPDAEIVVRFDLDRSSSNGEEYHYKGAEVSAPLWKGGDAWEANRIYIYDITASLEKLEFSATVHDWNSGLGDIDLS